MKRIVLSFSIIFLALAPLVSQTTNEATTNEPVSQTNERVQEDETPLFIQEMDQEQQRMRGSYGMTLLRAFLTLAILIGLLVGAWYFIKRKSAKMGHLSHDIVNVLSTTPVAPNKYVVIVEIREQVFVIGVGDDVTFLSEIADTDAKNFIRLKASEDNAPSMSFADSVKDILSGFGVKPKEKQPVEFTDDIKERIRGLNEKENGKSE